VEVYEYVRDNAIGIRYHLDAAIRTDRSIKWYATVDIAFSRTTPDGDNQHSTARSRTQPDIISDTSDVTADRIACEFLTGMENFNRRRSNWVVESILDFRLTHALFRPHKVHPSLPRLDRLLQKNAIINIQNLNDEMCSIPFWPLLTQLTTKEIRE